MFASRTKKVLTVKDDDKEVFVTIRKLSDRSLMKAAESRQIALAAQVKPFGADMLQAMRESASKKKEEEKTQTEKESRKSRALAYDRETILTQGIESWTASERLSSEAIADLDVETAEFLHIEIVDLSLGPLTEEERAIEQAKG